MVLLSYPVTMVLLSVAAVAVGGPIGAGTVVWGSASGVALALGGWWFYAALGSGPISVVSPLSAVLSAGVPVAVGLAVGERPSPVATVGIMLALVAVVLVSREVTDGDVRPHRFTAKVAFLTVGAGVAFGLNFVFIDQTPAESGLWPLMFARIAAAVLVVVFAAAVRDLRLPVGEPMKLAWVAALLDAGGNIAMLLALRSAPLSLASVLISLYPVVTVVLAIAVLRERAHRWQVVGLVLALLAVAAITRG
ncbi:MAG TPA: EamA family transporter [Mycobacterium sp.]